MGKIAFGTAAFSGEGRGYGFGASDHPKSLVEFAIENDVTVFDSAPIYGFGRAEIELGKAIKSVREKVQIISKSGVGWHENLRVNMSNDPKQTKRMLEGSLRRLDSEYIDIYMIHWPDSKIDIRYPLEIIANAQIKGKVKHIGLSNTNNEDLGKAKSIIDIEYIQMECNLFNNTHKEITCAHDAVTMGWGTFDKGILAGTVTGDRKFEKDDARSWAPWWKKSNWKKKVEFVNRYRGDIFTQALHYSLNNVDLTLCGPKTISQFEKLLISKRTEVDLNRLEEIENEFKSFS